MNIIDTRELAIELDELENDQTALEDTVEEMQEALDAEEAKLSDKLAVLSLIKEML